MEVRLGLGVVGVVPAVRGGEEALVSSGELECPYMLSNNPSAFLVCSSDGRSTLLLKSGSK